MRSHVPRAAVILFLLPLAGYGQQPDTGTVQKAAASNYITGFDQDVMKRVTSEARKTYFLFTEALANRKETMRGFAIKKGFTIPGGETTEDIWLTDVTFDGTNFTAKVSNDPVETRMVKRGDVVQVKPADLSDWMYIDDGFLKGGYTIRLITVNQTKEEREQFEQRAGFKIK